jgi:hypothetical protein
VSFADACILHIPIGMALHHPTLYLSDTASDDLVVLQVEDRLFRVHRSKLTSASTVFDDLFSLPQDPLSEEGKSDGHPIHLSQSPLIEFEQFLEAIYAPSPEFLSASPRTLLVRAAAAARWDAPIIHTATLAQLANSDDSVAKLIAARRYGLEEWLWPVFFSICNRDWQPPTQDVLDLSPEDITMIDTIRNALKRGRGVSWIPTGARTPSPFEKENRLRQLLQEVLHLQEPPLSNLPPPNSGYRIRVKNGTKFPFELAGETSFKDISGPSVYLGSAIIKDGHSVRAIVPCKVTPGMPRWQNHVSWNSTEKIMDEFEILPFDKERMEWMKVSNRKLPENRTLVEGGYGANHERLFHAYGFVRVNDWGERQIACPGKTSKDLGGASLPFGGGEHIVKDNYYVLAWK